jgi:hypothetical protein
LRQGGRGPHLPCRYGSPKNARLPGLVFVGGDWLLQAINGDVSPVDPLGARRAEKHHRLGNLLRCSQSSHRKAILQVPIKGLGVRLAKPVPAPVIGLHCCKTVRTAALAAPLDRCHSGCSLQLVAAPRRHVRQPVLLPHQREKPWRIVRKIRHVREKHLVTPLKTLRR